ncbi:MAG: hypothetical protein V7745_04075 [Pseudomonadales bacterium]
MKWEEYINLIEKWDQVTIDPKSFVKLEHSTPVTPKEYLGFADKDLLLGSTHGLVNAMSNAKRAINCQITSLLAVLGMQNTGDFQTKFQRFEDLGILAPRVNKKITKFESQLDKQFCKPSIDEVEDAIDLATLFVEATDKVFQEFMDSWWVTKKGCEKQSGVHRYKEGNKTFIVNDGLPQTAYSDGLYIQYDQESGDYGVWGYLEGREVFEAEILCGSALDVELIKCSILTPYKGTDSELKDLAIKFVSDVKGKGGACLSESNRSA